jgi:hypothetical protein
MSKKELLGYAAVTGLAAWLPDVARCGTQYSIAPVGLGRFYFLTFL